MGDPKVRRFLKLLSDRGFVQESLVTINGMEKKLFRFGPQGTLLRKNIIKEWWDAVVSHQVNTFCLESSPLMIKTNPQNTSSSTESSVRLVSLDSSSNPVDCALRASLSKECLEAYLSSLQMTSGQLPLSLASTGQCFNLKTEDKSSDNNSKLLNNGLCETHLLSQHYLPPVNVAQAVEFWTRKRLSWWKKFSTNPSKICSSTSSVTNGNKTSISRTIIGYSFPWGIEPLETIDNHGNSPLLDLESKSGPSPQVRHDKAVFHAHLLECQTSVESCMAAFLTDSYREKTVKATSSEKKQDIKKVLQLHPLLCPYHVALSVTGSKKKEVFILSQHVAKELREGNLSVLHLPRNSDSMESQYRRNDELGVPYTVVLSDQTLESGVIIIRSRDTSLKQQHHIKDLQSILLTNLHPTELVK
ncbi:hypothetical protein C0Q70_00145 [Pomacea canaliculata]|uniref:Anticodon-binding domain-containing protein n=3 Tax=Pomacea canaliculata TaxID=400727 RepID=A0A2T7PVV8_POMCA|nr:DNA polymerase subunit gamma-2, mitochondrial-like isoform X2 [Pomacea canaliculata]PVD37551.1 hypothetical protein C0Q70_00145 [Pomacea canaliculata]